VTRHNTATGNRAVSAMFRVFGGAGRRVVADAFLPAPEPAMHRAERWFFSVLVPVSVAVIAWDFISRQYGAHAAVWLTLPAALILLHVLPFLLAGRSPAWQWRLWLGFFATWSVFHMDSPAPAGWLANLWLGILCLNLTAWILTGVRASMEWKGITGVVWRCFLLAGAHAAAVLAGYHYGWLWALAAGAGIAALLCLAILHPRRPWLGGVACEAGDFLVTIDDGPDPETTPALLDLLDRHQTKALFFLIGEKAARHPQLAREILHRGHDIGNHTLTHPQATFWCAGPWRTWREISGAQAAIRAATGHTPRWFRAPVGHRNLFTHPLAAMLGLKVMAWSRRGFDAVEKDPQKVLRRILPGLRRGDIILLHDATPIAARVLEPVLQAIRKMKSPEA
jgi:peptidoglycan/xylan/chitin deacetylase (PgdA/CDA1 family)